MTVAFEKNARNKTDNNKRIYFKKNKLEIKMKEEAYKLGALLLFLVSCEKEITRRFDDDDILDREFWMPVIKAKP